MWYKTPFDHLSRFLLRNFEFWIFLGLHFLGFLHIYRKDIGMVGLQFVINRLVGWLIHQLVILFPHFWIFRLCFLRRLVIFVDKGVLRQDIPGSWTTSCHAGLLVLVNNNLALLTVINGRFFIKSSFSIQWLSVQLLVLALHTTAGDSNEISLKYLFDLIML